ncbi:MAG: hypothetical protein ACK5LX_11315 [Oscillospiraceae bacterium]
MKKIFVALSLVILCALSALPVSAQGALPQTGDPMGGMLGIFAVGMVVALVVIIVIVIMMRRK